MFNLLMRAKLWGNGHDTFPKDRMFEFTDPAVSACFQKGTDPIFDELIKLPCLFMQEGQGAEIAQVGWINRASVIGGDVSLEYTYATGIGSLLNSDIMAKRQQFGMARARRGIDWGFSRTYWAVKDIDLFRVLLRESKPPRQHPTVFTIPDHETIDQTLASAMIPFDSKFNPVFDTLTDAASAVGLSCRRADEFWEHHSVIADVIALIDRSRVVICDCTGKNPNVFYEIGIAHTLGREVILIAQSEADVPFDLRHLHFVEYVNSDQGLRDLQAKIEARLLTLVS